MTLIVCNFKNEFVFSIFQSRRSSSSSRSSPKSSSLNVSNASTPSHTPGNDHSQRETTLLVPCFS